MLPRAVSTFSYDWEKAKLFCNTWKLCQYQASVAWLHKEALFRVHIFYSFFSHQELCGFLLKVCWLLDLRSPLMVSPVASGVTMVLNAQMLTIAVYLLFDTSVLQL